MVLRAALFSCPFVRSKNEGNNTFFRIASIASGYRNVPSAFQGLTPMPPLLPPILWELHCVQSAAPSGFAAAKEVSIIPYEGQCRDPSSYLWTRPVTKVQVVLLEMWVLGNEIQHFLREWRCNR